MNLFLTGDRNVGKSTIINRVVNGLALDAGGFHTLISDEISPGVDCVYILPYGEYDYSRLNPIGKRDKNAGRPVSYPEVFDTFGVDILNNLSCEVIILDELGFMERKAKGFQDRVLEILDGDIPVLGVIKKDSDEFLDRVKEKVQLIEVTMDNRKQVLNEVKEWAKF